MTPAGPLPSTWRHLEAEGPRRLLLQRANALRQTRQWFWQHGFIEIDPPILAPWSSIEPHLHPLATTATDSLGAATRLYAQTSPEYALKKLLAAGVPDCFSLGHAFRDRELSEIHQPEFMMLEWYRVGADYRTLIDDTETLVADLAMALHGSLEIVRDGHTIDLAPPWERITVSEALLRWARVDIGRHPDDESFRAHAREQGHSWVADEPWDELFYKLLLTYVEPHLGRPKPAILYEYPPRFGALARRSSTNLDVVERFEAYIAGVELCNAFGELTDPVEQRERFVNEQRERKALGRESLDIDEDLLDAIGSLPRCSGNALGFDRLAMLLLGADDVAQVVWFPHAAFNDWRTRQRMARAPLDTERSDDS